MTAKIIFAAIGLDLDDAPAALRCHQHLVQC